MKELKPRIHENGIDYVLVGDYYVPDWTLPDGGDKIFLARYRPQIQRQQLKTADQKVGMIVDKTR